MASPSPQAIASPPLTSNVLTLDKRVVAGPLPPSPPASVTHDEDDAQPPSPPAQSSSTENKNSHRTRDDSIELIPRPPPLHRSSTESNASRGPLNNFNSKAAAHLSADGYLQPPPMRPTRRNTIGSSPKVAPPASKTVGELEEDIQLHADNIRRERLSKRAKAEAEAALTRKESKDASTDVPLIGNLIGEGHVNYVLMYNMLTGIRIGVSRCQAKIKRPLTDADYTAQHKFSFDIVGNELTPSAKYDFKFKDYAPWVFRSLREDHFHLDPADYLLSLTSKYILSELGSPGKSGSFFYFSRDYRFIIKTIHHAEHSYLLRILPQYYAHVQANPHTLLSRFYGLHRVKLPRGQKIHFVIMNNIFPPHRDIHETYDLKGSTVGREYPEDQAAENPRAVLKDLNWINRGRILEFGPEKRALLAEQLRRDAEFLKTINVMDYSLLVGIHNMQRGNRDNVRRNTLKVFSPHLPHTPRLSQKPQGHSHSYSHHSVHSGSPEANAMRRALYRTSGPERLDEDQLPDAVDPEPLPIAISLSEGAEPKHLQTPTPLPTPAHTPTHRPTTSSSSNYPGQHRDRASHKEQKRDLAEHFTDRQHFVFYQDEGGMRATDEVNEDMDTIYYVGVIDILTPYGGKKKLENIWKGLSADRHKISPVPPPEYADRFLAFMKALMRGGEGGARFKAE
ncbi:hypothetical protein H0H81_007258 [Sphagnurus paluster]|uniref:1-phosphatidylinositol-4-phosphate 5-kinase n=1 Tax=Sphagnurus paluster TaxID=117069 RepID=A0A9P7KLQ7_9AGAR|nr:hypothetical protein H0H81_007258 [Sphagnurus paluster]